MDPVNAKAATERELIEPLKGIGIDPKSIRMTGGGAQPLGYSEYFSASLTSPNIKKHNDLLADHADHLADRGIQLVTKTFGCGHTKVDYLQRVSGSVGSRSHYEHPTLKCPSCITSV